MVDWRDVRAFDELLTSAAVATVEEAAEAFMNPETRSLVAEAKDGKRIVIEFEHNLSDEWSDPAEGGEMRARRIYFVYIDGDPQKDVAFCGLNGATRELVTMDASRTILKRYALVLARASQAVKIPS